MKRVEGKVAIVTGAGAGIGQAVVQCLATEGAHVIAADINDKVLDVARHNPKAIDSQRCDVSDPRQVQELIAHCQQAHGRLDIVINNAGIGPRSPLRLHDVPLEDWDRVINVNQRGAFLVMKHALPLVLESGGGAVVNTASVGALVATQNSIAYLASKAALQMMTKAAALEYRGDNIRVNAICPGMTHTSIFDGISEEKMQALEARTTARMIEPEEVARLALFLACDESTGITGASYVIDDGRTAGV